MCWDEVDSIAKSSERPRDKRQPVECLPRQYEAVSSKHSAIKKGKEKR
jgi:hypothetical protein